MKIVKIVLDSALVSAASRYHMTIVTNIIDSALVSADHRYHRQIGRTVIEMKRYWQPANIASTLSLEYEKDPSIDRSPIP